MKKLFIIGNWKSNKIISEAKEWFQAIHATDVAINPEEKVVIVCPPFTLLSMTSELALKNPFSLKLGSQDFSAFEAGAHTGEEPPALLKEYLKYAIVGHSERRQDLFETDELIAKKIAMAKQHGITPILCVQGVDTPIPAGVSLVAYEPVSAIGTGHPDTPENAESVAKTIKEKHHVEYVLYGGSVTGENVHSFTQLPSINGVLVGGASLHPQKFIQIIQNS